MVGSASPLHRTILVLVTLLSVFGPAAQAQEEGRGLTGTIERGMAPIKIAIPQAFSDRADDPVAQELVATLRDDLEFSGYFDVIDPALYSLVPAPGADGAERHEDWLSIGADALIRTRFRPSGDRLDVETRLHDNQGGGLLFARRYGGRTDIVRRLAHQIADDLVRHYTGHPGVSLTLISFVSKHGEGKEIFLMDYDGKRIRRITTSGTINLSPTWSPDGNELAYVSWRGRQPSVYVMSNEGVLGHLETVGGELSSAPDWSPDGSRLVYTSDIAGNSEIYVLDRRSNRNTRLTRHPAIDTAPAVSPNGREIAFTSDRSGTPQIYLMDAEGLNVRRVSWTGSYNDSAAWSSDGSRLAFASRIEGRFDIVSMDLATEKVTRLTHGEGNNENPRWSPDGRHIVFASSRTGSYDIYTMRADGTHVRRLTRGGDCFTPDWSR